MKPLADSQNKLINKEVRTKKNKRVSFCVTLLQEVDPNLTRIIEIWKRLPQAIIRAMLALSESEPE